MANTEKLDHPPKLRDNSHLPRAKDFKPLENPTPKQLAVREAWRDVLEALIQEEQKQNGHKPQTKADE